MCRTTKPYGPHGDKAADKAFATPDIPVLGEGEEDDVAMVRKKSTSAENNNKQASSHRVDY